MSHIEDVARLKELGAKEIPATYSTTYSEYEYACGVLNAAPYLLAVAGKFQAGDAKRIEWILHNYPVTLGEENCDMLRRMLTAARIMEGEE